MFHWRYIYVVLWCSISYIRCLTMFHWLCTLSDDVPFAVYVVWRCATDCVCCLALFQWLCTLSGDVPLTVYVVRRLLVRWLFCLEVLCWWGCLEMFHWLHHVQLFLFLRCLEILNLASEWIWTLSGEAAGQPSLPKKWQWSFDMLYLPVAPKQTNETRPTFGKLVSTVNILVQFIIQAKQKARKRNRRKDEEEEHVKSPLKKCPPWCYTLVHKHIFRRTSWFRLRLVTWWIDCFYAVRQECVWLVSALFCCCCFLCSSLSFFSLFFSSLLLQCILLSGIADRCSNICDKMRYFNNGVTYAPELRQKSKTRMTASVLKQDPNT